MAFIGARDTEITKRKNQNFNDCKVVAMKL